MPQRGFLINNDHNQMAGDQDVQHILLMYFNGLEVSLQVLPNVPNDFN